MNETAQIAAYTIAAKMHNAIDYHLDMMMSTYDKESMLQPLTNSTFMLSHAWEGFRYVPEGEPTSLKHLCNIMEVTFDKGFEEDFAAQLTVEFRNYVTNWFEFRDEVATMDGQAAMNFEHEKELSVA